MAPLSGCQIVIAGAFKGRTQGQIERLIVDNGGTTSASVHPGETTHVVATAATVAKKGPKLKPALHKKSNVLIVGVEWLDECAVAKKRVNEKDYLISNEEKDADGDVTMAGNDSQGGSQDASQTGLRRSARTRGTTPTASQSATPAVDPVLPKKRGRVATKVEAVKEEDEDKKDNHGDTKMTDANPPAKDDEEEKPAKRARGRRGAAKAAPAAAPAPPPVPARSPTPPPAKSPTPQPSKPQKIKTVYVAAKGLAPVDEHCSVKDSHHVYVDSQGVIYDGSLNQTNIRNNANKFYYVQLLESNTKTTYCTWTRWGRVGETGQSSWVASPGSGLDSAMRNFEKKFRDKSGLSWADRDKPPKSGKYTYIEKNYADSDSEGEEEVKGKGSKGKGKKKAKEEEEIEEVPVPDSKLQQSLQDLMKFIFNLGIMQNQMIAMSYDANKLPLGKLSKKTLNQGFLILKSIGELMHNPSLATQKHGLPIQAAYESLTSQYYSVIPHAFGRYKPPVISDSKSLQREVDLIESLGDMQIASEVMKSTNKGRIDKDGNPINELDYQFMSLGLEEATVLDHESIEFKHLADYMRKTHGDTHGHINLKIMDIFRIERQGERARFVDSGFDKIPNDNRYLLWHGSRTTNFAGILSQGLRIAPPEAPVNGYMFGKGIYLADMASKSAGYCCAHASDNRGLLLLCEAQLGNPMMELTNASYTAAEDCKKQGRLATKGIGRKAPLKWKDAGEVHADLKGVMMPDTSVDTGDTQKAGASLWYNEYIVYDVNQVKLRYLFRCDFNSRGYHH